MNFAGLSFVDRAPAGGKAACGRDKCRANVKRMLRIFGFIE
jgi:hypothetical protein